MNANTNPAAEESGARTLEDGAYVIIMPCRDEERFIEATIQCLLEQTIRPSELVIVDDGSTDRTGEIADAYAAKHDWISVVHAQDRGERKVGGGVVDAFYQGYEALHTDNYAFLCKFDADITLPKDYFERILLEMQRNPRLGGASGKVFNPVEGGGQVEEFIIDQMVAGQVNFWRRTCWDEVGGYVREVMWDGIVIHRARMFGWETCSFRDEKLRIVHHRLMGSSHKGIIHGRMRWGRGQWFMGSHPLYILASSIFRMRERPYIIGGACIFLGYVRAWLAGVPRYDDPAFRDHLHRWQLKRLGLSRRGRGNP